MTCRQIAAALLLFVMVGLPAAYGLALGLLYLLAWALQDMARYGALMAILAFLSGALITHLLRKR